MKTIQDDIRQAKTATELRNIILSLNQRARVYDLNTVDELRDMAWSYLEKESSRGE